MGVGRVVGLVARHCPMLLLRVAPFVLCRPLAASFCCPEGEIGGRKEPGRKCRFWPSAVACGLPSSLQEVGGYNCQGLGGRWVVGDGELWIRMDWAGGT